MSQGAATADRTSGEGRIASLPRGASLFFPGDACAGFVVVHAGTIVVSLTAANGREIVLYRVGSGDICLQTFGCLVNGGTYSAQGTAETDLQIEMIAAGDFERRMADDPPFRRQLLGAVAARFGDLERRVADVALSSIAVRLAGAVLRLADGAGIVVATHEALAMEIGSAREVVSRQLGQMARDGLIETTRGQIVLRKPEALRALATALV